MKNIAKIIIALMLGVLVAFSTVSCDSDDAEQKNEQKDDGSEKKDNENEDEGNSEVDTNQNDDENETEASGKSGEENVLNIEEAEAGVVEENEAYEPTEEEIAEDDAREVLKDALDCLEDCDFDGLAEYLKNPGDYKDCDVSCANDLVDEMIEYYGLEFALWYKFGYNTDTVVESVSDFFEDILDTIDYEIKECTYASEKKVSFDVEIEYPDISSISLVIFKDEDEFYELVEEAYAGGIINGTMTDYEKVETLLDFAVDFTDNAIDNLDKTMVYTNITLVKKNGEWLIDDDFDNPVFDYLF